MRVLTAMAMPWHCHWKVPWHCHGHPMASHSIPMALPWHILLGLTQRTPHGYVHGVPHGWHYGMGQPMDLLMECPMGDNVPWDTPWYTLSEQCYPMGWPVVYRYHGLTHVVLVYFPWCISWAVLPTIHSSGSHPWADSLQNITKRGFTHGTPHCEVHGKSHELSHRLAHVLAHELSHGNAHAIRKLHGLSHGPHHMGYSIWYPMG